MPKTSIPDKGGLIYIDSSELSSMGSSQAPVDTGLSLAIASNINHIIDSAAPVYLCHFGSGIQRIQITARTDRWGTDPLLRNIPITIPVNKDGSSYRIRPLLAATAGTSVTVKSVISSSHTSYPSLSSNRPSINEWAITTASASWIAPTTGNTYMQMTASEALAGSITFGVQGSPGGNIERSASQQAYLSLFAKADSSNTTLQVEGFYCAGYGGGS